MPLIWRGSTRSCKRFRARLRSPFRSFPRACAMSWATRICCAASPTPSRMSQPFRPVKSASFPSDSSESSQERSRPLPFAEQLAPRLSDSMLLAERQARGQYPSSAADHAKVFRPAARRTRALRADHVAWHGRVSAKPGPQRPRRPPPSRPLLLPRRGRRRRDAHRAVLRLFGGNRPPSQEVVAARRVVRPGLADDQHSQGHLG